MKKLTLLFCTVLVIGMSLLLTGTSYAGIAGIDLGSGVGCSGIEDLDASTINNADFFTGRIGLAGVTGLNKKGKLADDEDEDGLTDSIEECINDSLMGHCGDVDEVNTGDITIVPLGCEKPHSKCWFGAIFANASICGVTECSDHIDNDGDSDGIDYPDDPDCDSYSDDSEDYVPE